MINHSSERILGDPDTLELATDPKVAAILKCYLSQAPSGFQEALK